MKKPVGNIRYRILSLLFMATVINYLDRSIIGFLGPTLKNYVFGWNDEEYSYLTISFKVAYSIGLLLMGIIIDKYGTKIGYTISIVIWSFFGLVHAFVTVPMGWVGFAIARFGLGFGESGNFPAAIKTVAEWFPKKERAWATGLFNAGSNIGALLAPLLIPLLVGNDGSNWQYAFFITTGFSVAWIYLWLSTYTSPEKHSALDKEELSYIQSDNEEMQNTSRIKWIELLKIKQTWAFIIAKTTDAVWLFYLFWGGFFLNRTFGLELKGLALPIIIIYLVADLGSIGGGWFSSYFIKRGWPVFKARKLALLVAALFILPVILAPLTTKAWLAVALIATAAAGHQAWSANVFTLVSDIFPKKATASVVGIGSMVGYASGALSDWFLGKALTNMGASGYVYAFVIAGTVYFIALILIHLILGNMEPLDDQLKTKKDTTSTTFKLK